MILKLTTQNIPIFYKRQTIIYPICLGTVHRLDKNKLKENLRTGSKTKFQNFKITVS